MSTQKPKYKIIKDGDERVFEDKEEWQDMKDLLDQNDVEYTAEGPADESGESEDTDESEATEDTEEPEVMPNGGSENGIDHTTEVVDEPDTEVVDTTATEPVDPEELSSDPIGFLQDVNEEFVNTIKGKPAISKQGFRFIQREFEISTESEVVQWIDDPTGCIVWAKAELPNGYSAEAHGEGYLSESKVDDNEFVRYADTRAKNRAISDLTSAGALAVSELSGEQ